MPLTMRATGLALPVDKDRQDFTIYCGAWPIGRIYEQRGGRGPHALVLVAGRGGRQAAQGAHETAMRRRSTRRGLLGEADDRNAVGLARIARRGA